MSSLFGDLQESRISIYVWVYVYMPVPTLQAQVSGAEDPAAVSNISFSPTVRSSGIYVYTLDSRRSET
jgi:hypothetical protein